MPRSRRRCSSAPSRSPWWSTCGRPGAGRARRSVRCSSRPSPPPRATVELAKVNVDDNPTVVGQLPGPVDPGGLRRAGRRGGRPVHRGRARGRGAGLRRAPGPGPVRGRPAGRGRRRRRGRGARCAAPSSSSPTTRWPSPRWPPCSSPGATPTRRSRCCGRIPETPDVRRLLAEARLGRAGRHRRGRRRHAARRTPRPGEGRPRRPAGVPRPARDARDPTTRAPLQYRKALASRLF